MKNRHYNLVVEEARDCGVGVSTTNSVVFDFSSASFFAWFVSASILSFFASFCSRGDDVVEEWS